MASKIKHKRSSVAGRVPVAADLEAGELALNTNDGKVYLKKDNNDILDITSTIFKNDTNVTVTDTGSDGTIAMQADGSTRMSITASEIQMKENALLDNAKTLQFRELNSNGTNYIGVKSPDSLASNYSLTLPTALGTVGQTLATDSSGNLFWSDPDTFGGYRVYVSEQKGDDANDGVTAPVRTIKRALQIASGMVYTSGGVPNGIKVAIQVASGDYSEDNPVIIPDNVSVLGTGLRSCIMRPLNANKDMLRVRTGCYFNEFTFRDGLSGGIPTFTFDYAVAFDDPLDTSTDRTGYTYLPSTKPVINISPFIQNVSIISFLGGNGALVDGSKVVTPNYPTAQLEVENPVSGPAPEQGKSMVANAFTMISFGGTGWRVINDAYAQLVSCFQIFMLNGTYTQSGGYVSVTNSATNFGLYALRASGYSPNAFAFDKGYIGTTGSTGSTQTITAFGFTRVNGPVEEFVVKIYDPSTNADLTSTYKTALPTYVETSFNSATAVDVGTDIFTISSHGFNNGDSVTYDANGGTVIGGLFDGDIYYVKYIDSGSFTLCFDDSLTKDVNINAVGSGTQYFRKQDYEMYVDQVTETHNQFQDLVLGAGSYSFAAGDVLEGTTGGQPNKAYVYSWDSGTNTLTLCINKVTIGITETRNLFGAGSTITKVNSTVVSYSVVSANSRTDLYAADFEIQPTIVGGAFSSTATLPGKKIWFHRPSITNSSSHTWEYAGSGTDYNALPQNGGKGVPAYEQVGQNAGKVYTSGTNELGDFKVGNFITAYNRTGNVTFTNKVTVDTLDVLKLGVGGIVVEEISTDPDLGENESGGPKDSRISTQLSIWSYANNRLGNVIDKGVSTNAIPGSLVQLNSNGQINSDLIPTSRSFTSFTSGGYNSRLSQVDDVPARDILSGDIATENFYQQELTLSSAVTCSAGDVVIQTTGNTATTAITSGTNYFTVTHSGAVTLVNGDYILLEGVTPAAYNGSWQINRAVAGSFTVMSTINPGTATVQGTIYYGGASGIAKADYTSSTSIIVASVVSNFSTPFTASANTLIINSDRTPSTTNTAVNPTLVTTSSSSSANYFLRASTSGQYLVLENTSSPTYTNASISAALRYNNIAYLTTSAVHSLVTGNQVKINAGTDSYDDTEYVTVISTTEFSYPSTAANTAASATTTATATIVGVTGTSTTGSISSAGLTGTITVGDYVFGASIPYGAKVTVVNMAVNPRTFTIAWPTSTTVTGTTTETLTFITPVVETGTVRSVVTAADSLSQGEVTQIRSGVLTTVNNLSGLTGGSGYLPASGTQVYYRVPLTNVTGSGVGALADITVSSGSVTDVDLIYGGVGYAVGSALSASNTNIGGAGTGFQILTTAIEKRLYLNLLGGQTFVATSGAPDFIEENNSTINTATATTTVVGTFDARSTGSGGGVDTATNRITTLAAHGFTTGDPVQYNPGSDPALGGLITNNVYYVKVISPTTVELYTNFGISTQLVLSTSTGSGHTLTRKTVDIVNNTMTFPGHGFLTGDAFRMTGSDLPYIDGVQITSNSYFFAGSVTTNSFTVHLLRSDALDSVSGITISETNLTAVGTGTIKLTDANIKATNTVNTSSTVSTNWNSLVSTNIDASNIISGIIATSRLASGTANTSTFLRGDSTWATAVKSVAVAASSPLSALGSGSSPYYGDITLDITKIDKTGGSGGYSTLGAVSLNLTQFAVGTGDAVSAGQAYIKAGVIDAGTLDTYDSSYFLNPSNLTSAVPVNKGGTNLTAYATGDIIYATGTTTLNPLNIGLTDTVMTSTGTAPQWSAGLTLAKNLSTGAAELTTTSTSAATVFNTNAKALNMAGAATSVSIGSSTASENVSSNVKSYTTNGSAGTTVTVNVGYTLIISTVARATSTATVTTTANHGLTTGDTVTVVCLGDTSFSANNVSVTVTSLTAFTYSNSGTNVTATASSGSVYIGATSIALSTAGASSDTALTFASTTGARAGMLVQGSANIPAGTYVTGVNSTRVYLSAALTGAISSTTAIIFTDTNTSLGIRTGDQITISGSNVANLDGTWPVTSAGAVSTSFGVKTTSSVTASNYKREGTIVRIGTLVLRNRTITIGGSEASATPIAATVKGENAVGTNVAGVDFTITPGLATGTGTNGAFIVKTGTTGSTGDTTATATERLRVSGSAASTTLDLTTPATTANLFNTNATTVSLGAVGTTVNVGTSAASATTVTLGAANSGNTLKVAGTAGGTIYHTTDVTSGTVEAWQSVTGTVKIGSSGTIQLGTSTGAATTVQVGGAITGNTIKLAGTTSGTVNLTTDVTTGTANIFTSVTGNINFGATSSTMRVGTLNLADKNYSSTSETAGITAATVVDSFAIATYRSAKYVVQVTCTAGTDSGKYQVSEILALQDGTTATMTDYAVIRTGNNLVTLSIAINGANAELTATPTAGNTIKVRVVRSINTL